MYFFSNTPALSFCQELQGFFLANHLIRRLLTALGGGWLVLRRFLQHILNRKHIQMEQAFWKQKSCDKDRGRNRIISKYKSQGLSIHWKATYIHGIPRRWDIILMKLMASVFLFCIFNFLSLCWNPHPDCLYYLAVNDMTVLKQNGQHGNWLDCCRMGYCGNEGLWQ